MALFKIYKGPKAQLPTTLHEGYAYFVEDNGYLYIDVSNSLRVQVNAQYAEGLKLDNGNTIDADVILTTNDTIPVENGGTGAETLTANAILIGNGTDKVKVVVINANEFVVGDKDNGVVGKSAEDARTLLDVYDTKTVEDKIGEATTTNYNTDLTAEGWSEGQGEWSQKYKQVNLTCGKNGTVPPLITCTGNKDEYDKIDRAEATPGDGITFYIKEKPSAAIPITIIDVR